MCLLALAVTVKPLANEIANHICYDRHKDSDEDLHCTHLLSVARLEKGSTDILPALDTLRKPITKKRPHPDREVEMGAFALDGRAVYGALRLLRHIEVDGFGRLKGDAALAVVRLAQAQIGRADHTVSGPGQAHHAPNPGQRTSVALINTVKSQ